MSAASVVVVVAVVALAVSSCALLGEGAIVLSSSSLETCVKTAGKTSGLLDGNGTATAQQCADKVVAVVAVDSGSTGTEAELRFEVSCVGEQSSGGCPCECNYAEDPSCDCRDLSTAAVVKVSRNSATAAYQLTYLDSFDAKPEETTILTNQCSASSSSVDPTCGWAYSVATGERIAYSQGFCCGCNIGDVLQEQLFMGGGSSRQSRGNIQCGLPNIFGSQPDSSAHCLTSSGHWYEGFLVGEPTLNFAIGVSVEYEGAEELGETLVVRPFDPVAASGGVVVELLGDLAGYTSLPVLSDKVLMAGPHQGASGGYGLGPGGLGVPSNWLAVDKYMVTMDGSECNKIGVSYKAFNTDPEKCTKPVGSCLENQLLDLLYSDAKRMEEGKAPLYMLSRYGVTEETWLHAGFTGVQLLLPLEFTQMSLVRIEMPAESLSLVVNSSPGEILNVKLCNLPGSDCSYPLEAMIEQAFLHVLVKNTGALDSSYTLTIQVHGGEGKISSVPSKGLSLAAQQTELFVFELNAMPNPNGGEVSCSVNLKDSQGQVTDQQTLEFEQYMELENKEAIVDSRGEETGPAPGLEACSLCKGIFALQCFLLFDCWMELSVAFGIMAVPVPIVCGCCFICLRRRGLCGCGFQGDGLPKIYNIPGIRV